MKIYKVLGLASLALGVAMITNSIQADQLNGNMMYRLYNPYSGEHFYTKEAKEQQSLVKTGWKDEGIGWIAPKSGVPVYRLYNKNAGDHHYTLSQKEKKSLVNVGWKDEGIGWYSVNEGEALHLVSDDVKPLYRAYNPNAKAGSHNYTTSQGEQFQLTEAGWKDEGIAWDGIAVPYPVIEGVIDLKPIHIEKQTAAYEPLKNVSAKDFLGEPVKVTVTGTVDTHISGKYILYYHAKDRLNQESLLQSIVYVDSVEEPIISGVKNSVLYQTLTKFDPKEGIYTLDWQNKPLKLLSVDGEVDAKTPGSYDLTYTFEDGQGHKIVKERNITVKAYDGPRFAGADYVKFAKNTRETFDTRAGVVATSSSEDRMEVEFTVSGTVDTKVPGRYDLYYTAFDEFGNKTVFERTVVVTED